MARTATTQTWAAGPRRAARAGGRGAAGAGAGGVAVVDIGAPVVRNQRVHSLLSRVTPNIRGAPATGSLICSTGRGLREGTGRAAATAAPDLAHCDGQPPDALF